MLPTIMPHESSPEDARRNNREIPQEQASEKGRINVRSPFGLPHEGSLDIGNKTVSARPIAESLKASVGLKLTTIWSRGIPADLSDAFVHFNHGTSDGLRLYPANAPRLIVGGENVAGCLMVPSYGGGDLGGLQLIPREKSQKLLLSNASFSNSYFTLGSVLSSGRVFVCTEIEEAWALRNADSSATVAVTFLRERINIVAEVFQRQYPSAALVIVSARGGESQAQQVAESLDCFWIELPSDTAHGYSVNDYGLEFGYDALLTLTQHVKAPPLRYQLLTGSQLLALPSQRWMIDGVLPCEGLGALFGPSGSGKSFLTLDIAATLASGEEEWFGRRATRSPVTYICLEGEAGMNKRAKAWTAHHKKSLPEAMRFVLMPFNLRAGKDIADLAKAVIAARGKNGLLIIDTLNRAAPGADENSSVDMGNLIAGAKQLQTLVGGFVLLVHHTGKDAMRGLRGHSSLHAALDCAIEVTGTEAGRYWNIHKSKDDVTGDAHPFKLQIVPVGSDDEGKDVSSCVAVMDGPPEAPCKPKPKLASNQRIAWDVLGEPLRNSIHYGKGKAPASRPCIKYEGAVDFVAPRIPAASKHQKSRAEAAIAGLVRKKYLGMEGDWLWDASYTPPAPVPFPDSPPF